MEDNYSLEGKLVNVFLRGSWEFTGRVEFVSKDKIVLAGDVGSLVVYKENIVAAMIIDEKKIKEAVDEEASALYDIRGRGRAMASPSTQEDLDRDFGPGHQNLYGAIIPEDMLEQSTDKEPPVSFSISMSQFKNINEKEIENGSAEKTPEHRGKNKERV